MKESCRAMVLVGPRCMEMQTFPLPAVGDDDGVIEVELAGVCGSDPGIYEGHPTHGPRPFPLIMGHEIVGRVARAGPSARQRWGVGEGDRVVVEYAFGCGRCRACQSGFYTACENKFNYGSMVSCKNPPHLFGAYSEYLYLHPNAKVHKIGEEISPEVAVLICAVLGNGVRWMRQIGGVSIGETVAIVGPGQQGLAAVAVAKDSGASPIFIIGLEKDRPRLEMAERFGADCTICTDRENAGEIVAEATGGRMADVVMDASGSPAGAEMALSLAGRNARVILPGLYKGKKTSWDLDRIVLKELRVLGVFSHDYPAVEAAIRMVRNSRYPFEDMITHRFPLEQAEQAVAVAAGRVPGEMPVKVVIDPKS